MKFTEADREAILAAYVAGHPVAEISARYGCASGYVSRLARSRGIGRYKDGGAGRLAAMTEIPAWVPEKWSAEYRQITRDFDEFTAAAEMRRRLRMQRRAA